jgi:hypothetical protein
MMGRGLKTQSRLGGSLALPIHEVAPWAMMGRGLETRLRLGGSLALPIHEVASWAMMGRGLKLDNRNMTLEIAGHVPSVH